MFEEDRTNIPISLGVLQTFCPGLGNSRKYILTLLTISVVKDLAKGKFSLRLILSRGFSEFGRLIRTKHFCLWQEKARYLVDIPQSRKRSASSSLLLFVCPSNSNIYASLWAAGCWKSSTSYMSQTYITLGNTSHESLSTKFAWPWKVRRIYRFLNIAPRRSIRTDDDDRYGPLYFWSL